MHTQPSQDYAYSTNVDFPNFWKTEYLALGSAGLSGTAAFRIRPDKSDIVAMGQQYHGSKQWEQISVKAEVGWTLGQNVLCHKEFSPKMKSVCGQLE